MTLPVSPHYARLLAELAHQRGFDGYLLNIETALGGGVEQTRALTLWIALLERELKRAVGQHAHVIWSVPSMSQRAVPLLIEAPIGTTA